MAEARTEIGLFVHALQFLTRLPVPAILDHDPAHLGRAARYFPAVGLIVGALAGAVFAAALWLGLPPLVAATLALGAQMLVTGALHEDGLADCADGLGGGATRERALEIMRDSRIGSYGALALGMSVLLRVGALAPMGPLQGLAALVIAAVLGRAAVVMTLVSLPYARREGLASGAARAGGMATVLVALGTALAAAVLLGGLPGLAAVVAAALAWTMASWRLMRRLQGYTGDGIGATEQLAEIAALMVLSVTWG